MAQDEKKKKDDPKKEFKKEVKVELVDMISSVKSRQLMSLQAKREREEMDKQNKERMEEAAEEERLRRQRATAEKNFQEGIKKAKLVLRRTPLGTDRNHNRYWFFSDVVPGLYIEKGWVHDSIDYSFTPPPEPDVDDEDDEADDSGSIDGTKNDEAQLGAPTDVCIETTIPKQGQNLWFICDSPAELEELVDSLHPHGVRESELKAKIESR
ncbi:tyrosine-protein kinase BAZ1B-like [Hippocampus comes]|uniref:tyrosine-protein kinase BAZ1B-like n=1 Tax=Hippocampus comes TaxID=109280 RepID=UPI00094F1454|nr:PREDICTED: tyrosine-protein kinase BAZ1B-like [Hippocampus comes]